MHMIPTLDVPSFDATSLLHRAPLSMSADDNHGFTAFITWGSQLLKASATPPLRCPDQLMNTSMRSPIPDSSDLRTFIPKPLRLTVARSSNEQSQCGQIPERGGLREHAHRLRVAEASEPAGTVLQLILAVLAYAKSDAIRARALFGVLGVS